jgi:hypothetical protein
LGFFGFFERMEPCLEAYTEESEEADAGTIASIGFFRVLLREEGTGGTDL